MRTFTEKSKASQQTKPLESMVAGRTRFGHNRELDPIIHLQRAIGNRAMQWMLQAHTEELNAEMAGRPLLRFGHDFSRIPIHPPAVVGRRPEMGIKNPTHIPMQFNGAETIRRLGGHVHTGAAIDAALHQSQVRAATIARDVYLRSDIQASPDRPENRRTLAHEAVHLLQQAHANGPPDPSTDGHATEEREAETGAELLLVGRVPLAIERRSRPAMRCQFDKEFGLAANAISLAAAQADPLWVENGIFNYFMESLKSPEIILVYEDGNVLRIPIKFVHYTALSDSGSITTFRRHRTTGRIVPFAMSQAELFKAGRSKEGQPASQVLGELVPPRFDPVLTPAIPRIVDAELMRHAAIGTLEVAKLQVGGALLRGAIRAGSPAGLFTTPRVVAGSITAGANVLDQALTYGSDWNKYNWGSVGFDFAFGMVTQSLVAKLFQKFPAPIFSKAALSLETWRNFGYQQAIFACYGTMVGLIRSQVGNVSPGKAVASQHIEGALQAAKSGAMDTFLKSALGLQHFPAGKNDIRIIFISKLLDIVLKAAVRQTLDVTPRTSRTNREAAGQRKRGALEGTKKIPQDQCAKGVTWNYDGS